MEGGKEKGGKHVFLTEEGKKLENVLPQKRTRELNHDKEITFFPAILRRVEKFFQGVASFLLVPLKIYAKKSR